MTRLQNANCPTTPLALLLALLSLSACHTPSVLDEQFGLAVRQAQSAQTLQPTQRLPQALPGADAGVVRSSIVRYEKTYVTPPSPVTSLDQGLGAAATTVPR